MGNRTSSKRGTLKALCSVKQRGDEGKQRREKSNRSEMHLRGTVLLHLIFSSQVISDQLHLIDFSGKFIMEIFWHKNTYKAAVMCHNVFYWLPLMAFTSFYRGCLQQKELGDIRSDTPLSLFFPPSSTFFSYSLISLSSPFLFIIPSIQLLFSPL